MSHVHTLIVTFIVQFKIRLIKIAYHELPSFLKPNPARRKIGNSLNNLTQNEQKFK